MIKSYVYWIYDDSCNDVYTDGYVGVSQDIVQRFSAHKRLNENIPNSDSLKIKELFYGDRGDCFKLELNYRPKKGIGWNNAIGGSHGWKVGFSHSDETKKTMKDKWTPERRQNAKEVRIRENKKLIGQKRPKQSENMLGQKNPMYGNTHSNEARRKISEAHIGKAPSNKIELYCIHCQKREGPYKLKKYHGLGKKNCKQIPTKIEDN